MLYNDARKVLRGKPSALSVYAELVDRTNTDGLCWPTVAQIAEEVGLSVRTVTTCIGELIDLGLLEVRVNQGGRANHYLPSRPAKNDGAGLQILQGRSAKNDPLIRTSNKNQEQDPVIPPSKVPKDPVKPAKKPKIEMYDDPGFREFWEEYPRKVKKPDAWKAWQQVESRRPPVGVIVNAIDEQKYCDQWVKDGGHYIPHPATWLRNDGWDDKPPETIPIGSTGLPMISSEEEDRRKIAAGWIPIPLTQEDLDAPIPYTWAPRERYDLKLAAEDARKAAEDAQHS